MLVNLGRFKGKLGSKSFLKCSELGNIRGLSLHLEDGVVPPENILYVALSEGHPIESMAYILKWFQVNTDGLITHAVSSKNYSALDLFFKCELPMSSTSMEHAGDDLKMLCFLIDKGCPMGVSVLLRAVCQGWVDVVRLLLEKGCPVNDYIIERAEGHAEISELLRNR